MKYIFLSDFEGIEDMDDGMYFLKPVAVGDEKDTDVQMESFSDGDLYQILRKAPPEADAIAMTDDWMFYNAANGMLFDYVFK